MLYKFLTLALVSLSFGQQIKINKNETVDYLLTYENKYNQESENMQNICFDSVYYNSTSIITHYHNLDECFMECAYLDKCIGVYYDYNSTLLYDGCRDLGNETNITQFNETLQNNTELYCYLLSDLGVGYRITNRESYSYTKIKHFNYTHNYNNYTIPIYVMESYPENMHGNTTVYIDSNHNGILDEGERNISTRAYEIAYFYNVSSGVHLVRTISPDFCHQLYPGMRGVELDYTLKGDGYVDNVQTYYHHGHSNFVVPHGGFINSSSIIANNNFSFILGNDNSTYLSMYPGYNITLGFIDETVLEDLYITTYLNSSTWAHVSVSLNNLDYYYLGELNVTNNSDILTDNHFNISSLKLEFPISFVRLHFMGNNSNDALNIVGIHTSLNSIESPEFSYLLGFPSDYYFALFYNNCYNDELCETYCFYMTRDFNSEESCLTGCNIFYNHNNCFCSEFNKSIDEQFYGLTFDYEWCNKGCHYELGWYVGPDFYPFANKDGIEENIITSHTNCSYDCLDELIDECYSNEENCTSFSISSLEHGHTYNGFNLIDSSDDILIIRKDSVNNFTEILATTETNTQTTATNTLTNTQTTATNTLTNTQTTATKTQTNTQTTATNTLTNTQTTATNTQTNTQTNTLTNTQTTATNTLTNTQTNTQTTATNTLTNTLTNTQTTATNTTNEIINNTVNSTLKLTTFQPTTIQSTTIKINNSSSSRIIPNNSSDKKNNTTVISILVSLLVFILLGFGVLGYLINKKRSVRPIRIEENQPNVAFDNPVYNLNDGLVNNQLYENTEPENFCEEENYLDIQ